MLCIGARVIGPATAQTLVAAFLGASFDPHPRFQRRLDKLNAIEAENIADPAG